MRIGSFIIFEGEVISLSDLIKELQILFDEIPDTKVTVKDNTLWLYPPGSENQEKLF